MTEGLEYGRIAFELAEEADRLSDPEPSQRDVLTSAAKGNPRGRLTKFSISPPGLSRSTRNGH
jgi:hypothetical protein